MKIVYIAGQGGHLAQFERFMQLVEVNANDVLITDIHKKEFKNLCTYYCGELRTKNGFKFWGAISHLYSLIFKVYPKALKGADAIISFGPGIAIVPAIVFKLRGKKVIHIETWSRFESKSLTGRLMYILSDRFYIQNRELSDLYPNGRFSGRL